MMTESTVAEQSAATGVARRDMNQYWMSLPVIAEICRLLGHGRSTCADRHSSEG